MPPVGLNAVAAVAITCCPGVSTNPAAGRERAAVDQAVGDHALGDQADAAGGIDVERDVAAAGPQVGDDRRAFADRVEVVDRQRHARFARHRQQMQDAVRRAAGAGRGGDGVVEGVARADLARQQVAPQQFHHERSGAIAFLFAARVGGARTRTADRREAQELEHGRHRVGGELSAARPGAGAGEVLDLQQLVVVDLAGGVRADRLEHVADRQIAALVLAGCDRTAIEHDAGDVQAQERHARGRNRLVAGDERDDRIETVAARDQFDRIGDHLAADERGLHPLGAHRDAVADRDGVEFERRAARRANAGAHVIGEAAQVEIARHRVGPRVRDEDQRFLEVVVGQTDGFEIGTCRGPIASVDDDGASRAHRCCIRHGGVSSSRRRRLHRDRRTNASRFHRAGHSP
jgi:hypothetical protein